MNIYQIVRTSDKTVVAEGFTTRKEAKVKRDKLNGIPANVLHNDHIVSRGSDHPNGPSFGAVNENKCWL